MYIAWPPNVISCVPAGSCQANGVACIFLILISYLLFDINEDIWQMNVVNWGSGAPGISLLSGIFTVCFNYSF